MNIKSGDRVEYMMAAYGQVTWQPGIIYLREYDDGITRARLSLDIGVTVVNVIPTPGTLRPVTIH